MRTMVLIGFVVSASLGSPACEPVPSPEPGGGGDPGPPGGEGARADAAVPPAPLTCSDPDGRDHGVAGTTSWTGENPGSTRDICVDGAVGETGAAAGACRGERCEVYELYCDGGSVAWEYVPCPDGCRDGACLPVPTCTDPDGRDYGVAGVTTWTGDEPGSGGDGCIDFAIPDYGAVVDECGGERCDVYELYCDGGTAAWEYVPCRYGCRAGACLPAPTCSDPDGRNYGVAGVTTWTGDEPGSGGDRCVDFGVPDYGAVVDECGGELCDVYELYCDGGSVAWEYVPCPHGCQGGACLPPDPLL